jgi:ketosteroid isomerase-like protein
MAHQDVVGLINRFVNAVNEGDLAAALERFTPDATIVEDIPPYRWQGPQAGSQWMAAMGENAARSGIASIAMQLGEATRVEVDADNAYAVYSAVLTLSGDNGLRLQSGGCLTFTLQRAETGWLINALAWGGPAPRP